MAHQNHTHWNLKIFFILVAGLLHLGCGRTLPSNVAGQSDDASRLPIATATPNPTLSKDVAYCNKKETSDLTVHLMVYYDRSNTYHPEFVRVMIPQINSDYANTNYQFVFRKWKASLQGETFQENSPLQVRVERTSDREPVSTFMDKLHWKTIEDALEKKLGSNIEINEALKKFNFVVDLKDPSASFDVLKISLYKDGTHAKDWNILIPAFYAHPLTYANSQNPVLVSLHPFAGQEGSSFEGSHFASVLNGYCF